jgi:tetratricopeptide (TPR) repeat protein
LRFRLTAIGMFASAMIFAGCVSQDQIDAQQAVTDYQLGDYVGAKALLTPLSKKTNEDFVLNNVRLGSSTLAMYDLVSSQAAFLQAYEVFNSFGVNNGGRTLGAVLVDEKIKIWRGEPFERAMANFYLGLIYYMQDDYNNARGAFENALFKLRDYQAEGDDKDVQPDKYKELDSNFVLAQYMLARCYQRLGQDDLATANFKRVAELRPQLAALADTAMNQQSNVLLIIDSGMGPRKIKNGDGAFVGFRPLPQEVGPSPRPAVFVDNSAANIANLDLPLVDLITLAQDRRWQSIDTVRAIKTILGTGLLAGGAYETATARNNTQAAVGLGMIAAGALLKASSQADIRMWEMLPRNTFAIPLTLPPGKHDITVQFPGGMQQTLTGITVGTTGESTYYFRSMRYGSEQMNWPPATLSGWPTTAP